jgi:hypothetical protein
MKPLMIQSQKRNQYLKYIGTEVNKARIRKTYVGTAGLVSEGFGVDIDEVLALSSPAVERVELGTERRVAITKLCTVVCGLDGLKEQSINVYMMIGAQNRAADNSREVGVSSSSYSCAAPPHSVPM